MKCKFLFILYILLAICGCTENDGKIRVDLSKSAAFDWDSHIDIVETIPLQISWNVAACFDRCIVSDKSILCYNTCRRAASVLDTEGNLLYAIDEASVSKQGCLEIRNAIYSHDGKRILILTDSSIEIFDAESGNYLNRISIDSKALSIYDLVDQGDGKYIFWSLGKNSIYVMDGDNMYPIKKRGGYPSPGKKFYQDSNGCLNVLSEYEPRYEICKIESDSITTKYSFDFGKWNLPEGVDYANTDEYLKVASQPYVMCLNSASETDEWLFVSASGPSFSVYFILMDKASGEISYGFQRNDIPFKVMGNDGKCFYGIVYPSSLPGKNVFADCITQYKGLSRDVPYLVKFKFKN